ncbi:MAG: hypothetical protein FWG40_02635, partial [Peptococcaceae bacterium]|nr:hypothetical protein [Peptococcaceae bacterium]
RWIDPWGLSPSSKLDRALGGVVGDQMQAMHLLPVAEWARYSSFLDEIGMGGMRDVAGKTSSAFGGLAGSALTRGSLQSPA